VAAAKKESDVHMSFYLTEEQDGKEKNMLFVISYEEIVALEKNIEGLRHEELQQIRLVSKLSSARDKAARHVSLQARFWARAQPCCQPLPLQPLNPFPSQNENVRECRDQASLKEVIGKDLKAMRRAIMSRVRDFQQLYDMVKNQRNRFVNLIQAARQGIAEMKEKHRILSNELDILRTESTSKDALLEESRSKHELAIADRNGLRAKLNKLVLTFKDRQAKVDEQIGEIDKLNAIINTAEKDMMRLKKQYEARVQGSTVGGRTVGDRGVLGRG